MQEAQISGGDRPVVWDGATRGQDLTTQLKNIRDQQVGLLHIPGYISSSSARPCQFWQTWRVASQHLLPLEVCEGSCSTNTFAAAAASTTSLSHVDAEHDQVAVLTSKGLLTA